VEVNKEDIQKIIKKRRSLAVDGNRQLLLLDLTSNPRPNKEARDLATCREMIDITEKMACLVGGLLGKFLGNLMARNGLKNFPTRVFTNEEEAIQWLLSDTKKA
jgi:hypothetical protein